MAGEPVSKELYHGFLQPVCDAWHLASLERLAVWQQMLDDAGFEVRECTDFADAVLANATILGRARLDLLLEQANGGHSPECFALWKRQYDTLIRAWFGRYFTIGRFLAARSLRGRTPASIPLG
jgi:hypothetical protein